jgi:hypothetical protein
MPRVPGSKANPRHVDLLTQLGNPALALFEQPTSMQPSPLLCGCCAGWLVSFPNDVPPAPRPSSMTHPSKRDNDALEEHTATNPMLIQDGAVTQGKQSTSSPPLPTMCGHPQPCAPIPSTVGPSSTLWILVLMERRHAGPCVAQAPPSARPSNWRTGCDQTHVLGELLSKPLLGEYKAATTSA